MLRGMLKCDFHMHCSEDPHDVLEHDAVDLINHAAERGYHVLAITLHGRLYCPDELRRYAASRGILLIPGIELYVERREVLLLGAGPDDIPKIKCFDDLLAFKKTQKDGVLVIAPHPFYGLGQYVGDKLEAFADLFDALEFCHFYTRWWNPNRKAEVVAQKLGKPMIACSDTHRLQWMNFHYSLVDAEPTRESVFAAIRAGKFQNRTRPLTMLEFIAKVAWHVGVNDRRKFECRMGWMKRPLKPCKPIPV